MNAKEMEALIIRQGEYLQAVEKKAQENLEAHMHLVQRADNIVEGFKKELAARDEVLSQLTSEMVARDQRIEALTAALDETERVFTARLEEQATKLPELRDHQDGQNDVLADLSGRPDLTARIEKLETLVLARNASAATKRNMTDEDALRVLTGDLRETSHKDAAEKIGLTYAQVYSCRLEFTFKHVHKDLRDNVKDWKNPWSK